MIGRSLVSAAALILVTQAGITPTPARLRAASAAAATRQDTVYAKQTSKGEVTLDLEPRWQDSVLVVEVTADTHSVDLTGIDLGESTRLIVADSSITPVEAGSLSGHHGSAELWFRIAERPDRFAIEIREVPDVPVRLLKWPAEEPNP